ncbi:hypothetical protein [Dictyobacter aurantiacus]|uniref:Uncharacterized protein n=1 Tax=Dictyobacter aurantiacus TaxID=1936993 RepID=A0A401ZGR5_9CHLR|nr:hypothetical protein [Dictyobacter aurantiacus]GCE06036.1 hypothetical protein KDAU_33650 [Dictyobacter aurantiacus]
MALTKTASPIKDLIEEPPIPFVKGKAHRSGLLNLLPRAITREGIVLDQHIREGRFQRSLSLITAFSSLLAGLEVTYEHYRGSYGQQIMYTPVIISPILAVAGVWGALNRRVARTVLPIVSLFTMVDGVVGFYFHVRGVARKPGGWRIPIFNVIMGPPVFAPLLFAISGFLGMIASLLRREDDPEHTSLPGMPRPRAGWLPRKLVREGIVFEQDVREGRFQRVLGVATAVSAFFSGIEALYSHYKNNFSYRVQWTPVLLTPVLMIAGIGTLWSRTMARTLLPLASVLALLNGGIGFLYHVRGVMRRPGGLKKPFYNLVYGPPIFAPLLFAASGFLGVLASLLRRAD